MSKKLTVKQRKFVNAYDGNASRAALAAGYSEKTAHQMGYENLKKPEIIEAIKKRLLGDTEKLIMSREERQNFWTRVALGLEPGTDMKDRLKATELLGKSQADFIDKVKMLGKPTVVVKDLTGKKDEH